MFLLVLQEEFLPKAHQPILLLIEFPHHLLNQMMKHQLNRYYKVQILQQLW
jgi:hypothetical protein